MRDRFRSVWIRTRKGVQLFNCCALLVGFRSRTRGPEADRHETRWVDAPHSLLAHVAPAVIDQHAGGAGITGSSSKLQASTRSWSWRAGHEASAMYRGALCIWEGGSIGDTVLLLAHVAPRRHRPTRILTEHPHHPYCKQIKQMGGGRDRPAVLGGWGGELAHHSWLPSVGP